ncbi:hypothetical protein CLV84_1029 [Neolewinella xylanilytica]|uniref:Uncharacterized protein n=1 Tax=Neolewinella xylanilytica TaxID=1514080 RepID=A0A2S6I990_9BACT|nr:contractile injection system tape measure protein [Neolewinella xylanilytica]PPK88066.1 hypothetical protein CLV84_1029 [Neolewinella xylanilytica]
MSTHVIGRQRIRIAVSSRRDADYILAHTGEICRNRLIPLVAEALDRLFPGADYYRIESLSLDIGQLPRDDFERVLVRRIASALIKKLTDLLPELTPIAPKARHISAHRQYLLTGSYPWFYPLASDPRPGAKIKGTESGAIERPQTSWHPGSGEAASPRGQTGVTPTSWPVGTADEGKQTDSLRLAPPRQEPEAGKTESTPPEPDSSRSVQEGAAGNRSPDEAGVTHLADWKSRLEALIGETDGAAPPRSGPRALLAWMVGFLGRPGGRAKLLAALSDLEIGALVEYVLPSVHRGSPGTPGRHVVDRIRKVGEHWLSAERLNRFLASGLRGEAPTVRQREWLDLMLTYRGREALEVLTTLQLSAELFTRIRPVFTEQHIRWLRRAVQQAEGDKPLTAIPVGSLAWRLLRSEEGAGTPVATTLSGNVASPVPERFPPPPVEGRSDLLTALLGESGTGAAEFFRDLLARPGGRQRLRAYWTDDALRHMATLDSAGLTAYLRKWESQRQHPIRGDGGVPARVAKTLKKYDAPELLQRITQALDSEAGVPVSVVTDFLHFLQRASSVGHRDGIRQRFFWYTLTVIYDAEPGRLGVVRALAHVLECLAAEYGLASHALLRNLAASVSSDEATALRLLLTCLESRLPTSGVRLLRQPVLRQVARIREHPERAAAIALMAVFRHRLARRERGWWEGEALSEEQLFRRATAADSDTVHRLLRDQPQLADAAFSLLTPEVVTEFIRRRTADLAAFIIQFARVADILRAEGGLPKPEKDKEAGSAGLAIGWNYVLRQGTYSSSGFVGFGIQNWAPSAGAAAGQLRLRLSAIARALVSEGDVTFMRLVTVLEDMPSEKPPVAEAVAPTLPRLLGSNGPTDTEDSFAARFRALRYFLLLGAPPPGEYMRPKARLIAIQEEVLREHASQAIGIYREVLGLRGGRRYLFLLSPTKQLRTLLYLLFPVAYRRVVNLWVEVQKALTESLKSVTPAAYGRTAVLAALTHLNDRQGSFEEGAYVAGLFRCLVRHHDLSAGDLYREWRRGRSNQGDDRLPVLANPLRVTGGSTGNATPGPTTDRGKAGHPLDGAHYLGNAGMILLAPFLGRYFNRLGMTGRSAFLKPGYASRACLLLHYLVTGQTECPEPYTVLNKVICGLPTEMPLPESFEPTREEIEISGQLLDGVRYNWEPLRASSVENLRASFFLREGVLVERESDWSLTVAPAGYDILLRFLPWTISTVQLPWMPMRITTEWGTKNG